MKKLFAAFLLAVMAGTIFLGFSELNIRLCMDTCARFTDPGSRDACYDGCHYGGHHS